MRDDRPTQTGSPGLAVTPTIAYYGSMDPRALWGEATALFIAGFGAAGYTTRHDLTAIARASFWAGRNGRDGPGSGQGGSRARSHGPGGDRGWELNMSPRSYMQEVSCECRR